MSLTPNDILQKRFATGFRGLTAEEVYAYLRSVAEEFEEVRQAATTAEAERARLEEQIEEFRHMEATLRNTLVSSQKVGQEIRAEAEHRAELIVREAELEAERILHQADRRVQELEQEVLRLVAQRRRFEAEFAALIETHSRLLHHDQGASALDFDEPERQQLIFSGGEGGDGSMAPDETPAAREASESQEAEDAGVADAHTEEKPA